jgi:hypothetical protein
MLSLGVFQIGQCSFAVLAYSRLGRLRQAHVAVSELAIFSLFQARRVA